MKPKRGVTCCPPGLRLSCSPLSLQFVFTVNPLWALQARERTSHPQTQKTTDRQGEEKGRRKPEDTPEDDDNLQASKPRAQIRRPPLPNPWSLLVQATIRRLPAIRAIPNKLPAKIVRLATHPSHGFLACILGSPCYPLQR